MDFKNLKGIWKLKRFCISCIELIFEFFLSEFCFQFECFFNFDFQMHKIPLKSFVFEIFLSEIIVRPIIYLKAKLEMCNPFSF